MTDKAIVSGRRGASVELDADATTVSVEHVRPDGVLVRGRPEELEALAATGARVKLLRDTNILRVHDHVIDIEVDDVLDGISTRRRVPRSAAEDWPHHLVQLDGPPVAAWLEAVATVGVDIVEPMGPYGLFVCGTPAALEEVGALPFVAWSGPMQPEWRLGRGMDDLDGDVDVRIGVCPPSATEEVVAELEQLGARVRRAEVPDPGAARAGTLSRYAELEVTIDAAAARNEVVRVPQVRYVEHAPPDELEDERSNQIVAESLTAAAGPSVTGYAGRLTDFGVDGSGTTIAVVDSGIDDHNNATIHEDLRGRFAFFADQSGGAATTDVNGHGTHVAAIAAGDGSTGDTDPGGFTLGLGVAPGSQVGSINAIGNGATTTVADWFRTAIQNGASVVNNSWGAGNGGSGYTARCGTVDGAVRDPDTSTAQLERLAVVFSAGNNGGFPTTATDPKEAKNVIVVGNSLNSRPGEAFLDDDVRGISGSSSRGPAVDGRVLPTVVAPGTDIVAARSTIDADAATPGTQPNRAAYVDAGGATHPSHTQVSGTSMAAPHVSGAVALLQERWRERTGQEASPAMVRALLVNTAEDLAGGPNWKAMFSFWNGSGGTFTNTPGFTPTQVVEFDVGNRTWTTLTQVADAASLTGAGQWTYAAGTDTLTVATTTTGRPYGGGPNNVAIWCLDAPLANVPNNDQGWGRVSLENLLLASPASDRGPRIVVDERLGFDTVGDEWTIRVAPADPARPLRITLAWTDAPGGSGANPALVNDLDLEVTEVDSGDVYRGNVFANGFSATGGGFDALHTTECVYVQDPSGVYEVSVIAASLGADARPPFSPTDPWQDFAIVLDNAEVPSSDAVDVAFAIDRSGSMQTSGYVDVTRTAARGFASLLQVDDGVGVASFGSSAVDEFPATTPATVRSIQGSEDRDDALAAVDGITFGGQTEMGAGLQTAADMLAASSGTRAVLLLSDGYDNGSPDARTVAGGLPAGIDVHTCAMGPLSDQALLEDVASATGGLYLYMPTIDDLFLLLNVMREQVTGTGLIVNTAHTASSSRVGGWVEEEASEVTFLVSVADEDLRWTGAAEPGRNEISVRLRAPNGTLVHAHEPTVRRIEGRGHLAFRVPEPLPGQWWVEVATSRASHTRYVVGGFVRSPVDLAVRFPSGLVRGRPLDVGVSLVDPAGEPRIRGAQLCVTAPTATPQGRVGDFRRTLRDVRVTKSVRSDLLPEPFRTSFALDRFLRKRDGEPLVKHVTECRAMRPPEPVVVDPDPGGPGSGSTGGGVVIGGGVVGGGGVVIGGGGGLVTDAGGTFATPDPVRSSRLAHSAPVVAGRVPTSSALLRRRLRDRLRIPDLLLRQPQMTGRWASTSTVGSYNATVTVHGVTASGSRVVRTTTRSVRVR